MPLLQANRPESGDEDPAAPAVRTFNSDPYRRCSHTATPGDQCRDFRDRLGCPVLQPFLQNGNTAADGKQEDIPLRMVVELGIVLKNDQIHQPHHIVLKAGVPAGLRELADGLEEGLGGSNSAEGLEQLAQGLSALSAEYGAFDAGLAAYADGGGRMAEGYGGLHTGLEAPGRRDRRAGRRRPRAPRRNARHADKYGGSASAGYPAGRD